LTRRCRTLDNGRIRKETSMPAYVAAKQHAVAKLFSHIVRLARAVRHRAKHAAVALLAAALPCAALAAGFTLSSKAVADGRTLSLQQVYDSGTCHGGNVSPDVAWRNTPRNTRSIAITLYDPDARQGKGWWHWIVVDIPAATHALPAGAGSAAGALPHGAIQARNDFGDSHFGGACPPVGDAPHHYQLTAWALDVAKLPVTPESTGPQILPLLKAHTLAITRITARYGR
jgi:Raf kinase inhibitor-like YbhB/YbcL family protein